MAEYLNIATQVKPHLRVDFDDDDTYIQDICDAAEVVIANELGYSLSELEDEIGNIPTPVIQAILMLTGHFYLLREPVVIGTSVVEVPFSIKFLLSPYKDWTLR